LHLEAAEKKRLVRPSLLSLGRFLLLFLEGHLRGPGLLYHCLARILAQKNTVRLSWRGVGGGGEVSEYVDLMEIEKIGDFVDIVNSSKIEYCAQVKEIFD
jgi:hypothetical protein